MPRMKSKHCIKCGMVKPLSDYYMHTQMGDGYLNKCKVCVKEYERVRRIEDGEKIRAYDRMRSKRPERRAEGIRRTYERIAKYPNKVKANVAVNNAVRDGRLVKQPCVVCGDPKSHGHHEDYSKPLEVIWFCALHHARHHAKQRAAAQAAR